MPLDCGSTTVSASIIAIAASLADPPACKISNPALVASGWADATVPAFWALAGTESPGTASNEKKEKAKKVSSFFIGPSLWTAHRFGKSFIRAANRLRDRGE